MSKSKPPKRETEAIDDDAVITGLFVELQAELKVLAGRRAELPAGDFDPDLATATAAIAKAALTALAERRQRAKARKRELELFTDDEIVERIRALPERRRNAIIVAVQGADLSGRPLFG